MAPFINAVTTPLTQRKRITFMTAIKIVKGNLMKQKQIKKARNVLFNKNAGGV